MAEIRRDLVKNNWVAIATDNALKPDDFPINKRGIDTNGNHMFCPFCEGNESSTPPEIAAYRGNGSEANGPGWSVRVIPNKFSVFYLEGELEKNQAGIYTNYNGVGRQEVVVETSQHGLDLHDFSHDHIVQVFCMLKQRYNELSWDDRIKYIQIYKNRGIFAGASQDHSHSQVMGLPFVPRWNSGPVDYYQKHGQCLLCAIIDQEKQSKVRLVHETEYFLLLCPYASRFSYETWIIPKQHCEHFGAINEAEIEDLAAAYRTYTQVMVKTLHNPAYNLIFNTAPINLPYQPGYHWYLEINPRMLVNTGVDIGTGIYMNPVAPELSAALFRENMTKHN